VTLTSYFTFLIGPDEAILQKKDGPKQKGQAHSPGYLPSSFFN